jgi:hypothetical protein
MRALKREIENRAHNIEGQGDGIFMVLIRMDEIIAAVKAARRKRSKKRSFHKSEAVMTSEELFEMVRKNNRRLLAVALYEWDDGGCGPFDNLPEAQRLACLDQADYVLARFNINKK